MSDKPIYHQIYALVRQIPRGRVTTYGYIASQLEACTPRMVGYAMSALPFGADIPWQRVINAQGKISPRGGGDGALRQRQLLEAEGLIFDEQGRVDFDEVGWFGGEV